MNCGATSPEGARVMGLPPLEGAPQLTETVPVAPPTVEPPTPVLLETTRLARPNVFVSRPTSVSAVVSFILGCVAWFGVPVLGAMGAVISGHFARREIRLSGGRLAGAGFATAGLVLGYVQIVLLASILFIVVLALGAALTFGQ
jgi:hypothetical protein